MNHVLYDRIIEILKSGKQLTVNYTPYHKGCECELTTNVEDNALYDYLQNALEFWWYDDLIENYLKNKEWLPSKIVIEHKMIFEEQYNQNHHNNNL